MSILSLKPLKDIYTLLSSGVIQTRESESFEESSFESLPVTDTLRGLSAPFFEGMNKAVITVSGGDIRFRVDGGTPTENQGMLAVIGTTISLSSYSALFNFKAIRAGVEDAQIDCTYLKIQ